MSLETLKYLHWILLALGTGITFIVATHIKEDLSKLGLRPITYKNILMTIFMWAVLLIPYYI